MKQEEERLRRLRELQRESEWNEEEDVGTRGGSGGTTKGRGRGQNNNRRQ